MKRILIHPGKVVQVSDEALARARQGLQAFGADKAALDRLNAFPGDTTSGPKYASARTALKTIKRTRKGRAKAFNR
jgi:hypothetical protein